jgi:hypothetical protein
MEIKELLESDEFKKAVRKLIEQEINNGIDAEEINDLDSKVEEIINSGTFETTFTT